MRGDLLQVGVGQFAVDAVDEGAEFAGVDEEGVLAAVAEAAFGVGGFVFREEPEADGDLGAVEELAGEGDHAIDEVGLDEGAADVAFAGLVGGHGTIGENEAGHAVGGQVVDDVLDPAEVGVALRWQAVFPPHVVVLAEPVADVEGKVGEDVVGLEVGVEVVAEGVSGVFPEIALDAADGEIHEGELPGGRVRFLAVDGDIAELAAVGLDEFLALHEEAAGAIAGVIDAALVRGEHEDQQLINALRGVELAAALALLRWRSGRGSIHRRVRGYPWRGFPGPQGRWCR